MAEDVLIIFLINEVTELILGNEQLCIKDIINFSLTCKELYKIVQANNKLWKIKFFQRWPLLRDFYIEYERNCKVKNWLNEVQSSINSRKALMHKLSLMSVKYYKKQELSHSEFKDFDPLFDPDKGAHPVAYYFLVDELINLIERPIIQSNLTNRYYAYKVVRYMKQNYIMNEWQKFIKLPAQKQLLELGATLVAQWSQPEKHVSYRYISDMLDNIVEHAKSVLKERSPSHSLFTILPEQLNYWKNNNIDDNQWSIIETKQVMEALREVMFNKLGFHGNNEMHYKSENFFINKVLEFKHGISITLAIVFESICRRLGVKCEPISFPAHFLLRWKEKYSSLSNPDELENFYIDVFNGGQFLTKKNCPRIAGALKCPVEQYNKQDASTAVNVVERMANNLEIAARQCTQLNGRATRLRSALELLHMVRPHDTGAILHLSRFYMLYQMDLAKLVNVLSHIQKESELICRGPANHILQMLQDYEKHMATVDEEIIEVKKRTSEIKYTIGMIMKHHRHNYLCVITGWDFKCEASPEWILEFQGAEQLDGGSNQPFYNVFVDDGSSRYVAQENLIIAENPGWVNHFEIGRYFCNFKGSHYVPNEEKAKEYPDDAAIREKILSNICKV